MFLYLHSCSRSCLTLSRHVAMLTFFLFGEWKVRCAEGKNWHDNDCFWDRIRYDGEWYSAVVACLKKSLAGQPSDVGTVVTDFK